MTRLVSMLAAGAAMTTAAMADNVVASDAAALAAKITSFGYTAELSKDSTGDPQITVTSGGATFNIFFYGCTGGTACKFVQFNKCWDREGTFPLDTANRWNRTKTFGTASVDEEGDPCFDMTVNFSGGGVASDNLSDDLQRWDRAMGAWREMMGP